MATAFVALGSNLGDRDAHLLAALDALRQAKGVQVTAVSGWFETAPVGGPLEQGAYLNAAAALETTLPPLALLKLLLDIEAQAGRVRLEANGPRPLDLDLLFHGDRVLGEPNLVLPHPRLHERLFVLKPLAQLAPRLMHPVLQKTVAELLAERLATPLLGTRALVTGGSSGIGRAIALAFLERGADVIVTGRNFARHADIVEIARGHGRQAWACKFDLRDEWSVIDKLVDDFWTTWNGLDLVVCNAGADILTGEGAAADYQGKLERLLQVDVRATMILARALGAKMKEAGAGCILTMGWDQAETGMEGDSGQLFAAAKGAVIAFTKSLAKTLAPEVRVNCLAPGWIKTAWGEQASEGWQRRARGEAPLGRWGRPDEIAAAACWLASAEASFITGQTLRVNGGAVM